MNIVKLIILSKYFNSTNSIKMYGAKSNLTIPPYIILELPLSNKYEKINLFMPKVSIWA